MFRRVVRFLQPAERGGGRQCVYGLSFVGVPFWRDKRPTDGVAGGQYDCIAIQN